MSQRAVDRVEQHRCLVDAWVADNAVLEGNGWEAYPQSLRIVNWIKWFLNGEKPKQCWLDSLAMQAHVLRQNLEYHLLGNHLFENGKALIFAGIYFEGAAAQKWLDKGLEIVDAELVEQVLGDGGNFELSPMYHNLMLHGVLDLINLAGASADPQLDRRLASWKCTAAEMLGWMNAMLHPDGEVAFFNDAALGVAVAPALLEHYADELDVSAVVNAMCVESDGVALCHLADSGYLSVQGRCFKSLLDCARVGPDYLPGHAHADTLSFELSVRGQRLFVNSGTSCYGVSAERLRQRQTAAHNTLEIDGFSSSEVWGGFRVARRAYPAKPRLTDIGGVEIECAHDGYARLFRPVTHRRKWSFTESSMRVVDRVVGRYSGAKVSYHLHPSVDAVAAGGGVLLILADGSSIQVDVDGGVPVVEESTWHPQFGLSVSNKKITISLESGSLDVNVSWA